MKIAVINLNCKKTEKIAMENETRIMKENIT